MSGFKALLAWAATFGSVTVAGVEGTGAYGAGLARFLTARAAGRALNTVNVSVGVDEARGAGAGS